MASFIPIHRKKKESLERKEGVLRRLIASGSSHAKRLGAALAVRDARVAVLRAKQNSNSERNSSEWAVYLKDEVIIQRLRAITAEAVLAEFLEDAISG